MEYVPVMYATFWALVPPLVAIILALITKEVYSSLFVGIVIGGLFYGDMFSPTFDGEKVMLHIFEDGLVGVLSDSYNVGILVFLVNGPERILKHGLELSWRPLFWEF